MYRNVGNFSRDTSLSDIIQKPPKEKLSGEFEGRASGLFIIVGFFGILMMILIPVWDGLSLLSDPAWMYMAGDYWPHALILCVASIPALFMLTVIMLFACGSRKAGAQTEQTMLVAALLFTLLLGSMLLLISQPIARTAHAEAMELTGKCKTGVQSSRLYKEYMGLQKLRDNATCAALASVESCSGFQSTPESQALKKFEQTYLCSGFCFYPKVAPSPLSTGANGKALLQLDKKVFSSSSATSQSPDVYPPALFSNTKYQGSCSAMAARDMESFVGDMSEQLMWEGFFLIGASILQSFLMVLGLFAGKESPKKSGYGTIPTPIDELHATAGTIIASGADFRRRQKMVAM